MIKKDIFDRDIKAQFQASAKDKMYRFMMAGDRIKGAVVHATRMVNEMRANHEFGPLETLVLGQAYMAAILMTSGLKGKERLGLAIGCSGPIKGLNVEANVFGEVRGFLKTGHIQVENPGQVKGLSSLFGAGLLTVTKYLEGAARPYSGQVAMEYGSIAEDLANYFLISEQIPTGFKLSLDFDENEQVRGAGGIFLQAMPGADPDDTARAEKVLQKIDSLGQAFADGEEPEALVTREFSDLKPRLLDSSRVEFFCRCSLEKMAGYLKGLPEQEKKEILEQETFPIEVRCHNCNSAYRFTRENIKSYL